MKIYNKYYTQWHKHIKIFGLDFKFRDDKRALENLLSCHNELKRKFDIINSELESLKEIQNEMAKELLISKETIPQDIVSTKLGVTYNAFDGLELLEPSILSIRECVDYINVVFQQISNFKTPAPEGSLELLQSLKDRKLIDKLIIYEPNFAINAALNETEKRNIGLQDCKANGCGYVLNMDCDEFYDKEQFKKAFEFIKKHNITSSACMFYNYIKEPVFRYALPNQITVVPFIQRVNSKTEIRYNSKFGSAGGRFGIIDPTRLTNNTNESIYHFNYGEIIMHHMWYVRKNLKLKLYNSTYNMAKDRAKVNEHLFELISNYTFPNKIFGYDIIKVDDKFNIKQFLE